MHLVGFYYKNRRKQDGRYSSRRSISISLRSGSAFLVILEFKALRAFNSSKFNHWFSNRSIEKQSVNKLSLVEEAQIKASFQFATQF